MLELLICLFSYLLSAYILFYINLKLYEFLGKLPKYLNTSLSQHAYTSGSYELVKPSPSGVIMPAELIVLRRSQPLVGVVYML